MRPSGDLFIVSSPSGAGKTTIIRRILDDPAFAGSIHFSVSHTTRAPRPGEVHGREYFFVSTEEFESLAARDGFLEHAVYDGNRYGTSRGEVEARLAAGIDVLLDIDVQGARQVKSRMPDAVKVFVFPPSRQVLETRLRTRGHNTPESIARRLEAAAREMGEFGEYNYAIINDVLDTAVDELRSIVVAQRARSRRRQERLEAILRTFPA